jgi:malonate transporter
MLAVVIGFGIIALVVAVGYGVGRLDVLGPHAVDVLTKAAFFVFSPALLFVVLGRADIGQLFSNLLPVSAVAAGATALVSVLVGWFLLKRGVGTLTVGALAASYVNANNIGLPLAAYVLGDPALVAPILLLQLIVITPLALTILDVTTRGSFSLGRVVMQPIRNPLIIGSFLGVIVSATNLTLPVIILEPLELLGQAAVPTLLFVLGLSLASQKLWDSVDQRKDIVVASSLKLILMPLIAWVAGRFLFELDPHALYTVVLLAALPSAQNVFNYAKRYEVATVLGRDTVVITTVVSLPLMMLVAFLLAPG